MRLKHTRHGSCPAADDDGLADYWSEARFCDDAKRGSHRLLKAIHRALLPKRQRVRREYRRYGTIEDRQLARIQVARLQREVAEHFGIPVEAMTAPTRGPQPIAEKRQIAMYLARNVLKCSYPEIARCFARDDHTTVIHACHVVKHRPELASLAEYLSDRIAA